MGCITSWLYDENPNHPEIVLQFLIEKGTVGIMFFFLKLLKSCDLKLAWVLYCQSNKTRWQKFEEQISDSERNCVLKWG